MKNHEKRSVIPRKIFMSKSSLCRYFSTELLEAINDQSTSSERYFVCIVVIYCVS